MKTSSSNVVFKGYNPGQLMLLPPSLEAFIDDCHPVRVVEQVIEETDIQPVLNKCKGGGSLLSLSFSQNIPKVECH